MQTPARALALSLCDDGRFDDARACVRAALAALPPEDVDERLACLIVLCVVERGAKRYREALRLHLESYPLAQLTRRHVLKAKFHNGLGATYEGLAARENRAELIDRALIEYEECRFHLEEAGDTEQAGKVENNIAVLLVALGRPAEAREHLARARRFYEGDAVRLAEIADTEALACMAEGDLGGALACALDACRTFLARGEKRLLDDSLRTLQKAAADYAAAESEARRG